MALQDKLKQFVEIQGFAGIGIFKPSGKAITILNKPDIDMKTIGIQVSNILVKSQKASVDMGIGIGKMIVIEAENGHIIAKNYNEGADPLKTEPGKVHIHLILALYSEANLGLAKLKISSIIGAVVEELKSQVQVKKTE